MKFITSTAIVLVASATIANAFLPKVVSSTSSSALFATVESSTGTKKTTLKPPKKVEDLATGTEELYGKNVQTTYGYVSWQCLFYRSTV